MTKRRARQPAAPLGIHRDLWPYTLVAFLVGLLVAALGIGLLAALTFPGLRIRFDVGGAGRVALYAAGVVWTLFGLYAVLITPAYLRHKTHVFLFASPEPAEISLSVHESMDDRELLVVVGGERYSRYHLVTDKLSRKMNVTDVSFRMMTVVPNN